MDSPQRHKQSLATLVTRHLAYCCIWAQAVVSCTVLADTQQDQRLPVFRVDTQGRTPYEIGAELGRQWKNGFPELEPKLDALLAHRLGRISFTDEAAGRSLPDTLEDDPGGLTEHHREELEGLASTLHLVSHSRLGDGFLSRDELLLIQRLPDLGAHDSGSAFGVYASRSATGSSLVGLNLDGQPRQERMERTLASITVYRGEDRALVNIGFAGNLGITSGFNQSGLLLAYLPVLGKFDQGATEAASEPIAFTIRRVLETYERIESAAPALSWPIDASNYSILMADRERVKVLEHAAGGRGRLRDPSSKLQPAMSWGPKQQIAAVGCFALSTSPSACSRLREKYRWQRFRTLADLDYGLGRFEIGDIVQIMLDRVGSEDAINAPATYQTLAFVPERAELYLGRKSPTANDPVEPVMHRYADLIGESSHERGGTGGVWILLWLLITGIAVVTLWVRLRSRTRAAPSFDENE